MSPEEIVLLIFVQGHLAFVEGKRPGQGMRELIAQAREILWLDKERTPDSDVLATVERWVATKLDMPEESDAEFIVSELAARAQTVFGAERPDDMEIYYQHAIDQLGLI